MPVDNEIYNRTGDIWWDEHQPLSAIRTAINPARLDYFTRVLRALGVDPPGKTVVDIGCGGGLFAEEWARMGAHVIGVDPSTASLDTAKAHAVAAGLSIDYRVGAGEELPLEDGSVDIACCVDVLEHVRDVDTVISETARVLRSGGVYVFDTINRTRMSRLVVIKLLQDWRLTAWMPANLHDWDQFITPDELRAVMHRYYLEGHDIVGIGPAIGVLQLIRLLWQLRQRKISHGEFGRRAHLVVTEDVRVLYAGYATKAP
ncbi:MAG TPA: bifunctional 2-polyprenyl-6-hydroxyphenol methylase/3-demethylubiquinol 3-O-methyltransferase UbiG [Candidatus Dormibacteraeota bacterium]|nr:bifunctional 2-polyprenyl-6-hydroxyphenol methylase/3-demethylubiquinol 3-O-methyltransferase UbiG [Candidatus Dormibacteraeota bacterium]